MKNTEIYRHFFAIKGLEVSDKGSVRRTYKDIRTYS